MAVKRLASELFRKMGYKVVRTETFDRLLRRQSDITWPSAQRPIGFKEGDSNLSAEHFYKSGAEQKRLGDNEAAFSYFAKSISLVPRYEPARDALIEMSDECLVQAECAANDIRLGLLVRALEMNPLNVEARASVDKFLSDRRGGDDLTKMCFIFYDGNRARRIHEEAYRRALEFVTIGGVSGDVMEFGVLGGWSARIFCEIMRDILNLTNIHLYDSFEGLPEYDSEIDRSSYEIGGRKIWSDKMKFPDEFLKQFGQPHEWHIRDRLSEVIRPERVIVRKGFYSETLKEPPNQKASIVHFDCDLYQSAAEVFEGLYRGDCLQDGTVLLFDDWNCNRANPNFGQRRALAEFLMRQEKFTASSWYTYGFNSAAYILHAL